MSMFSGIFQDVHSTDSGVDFSIEEVRFHLTDSKLEMDVAFEEMEHYWNALDRLTDVMNSIEAYDGKLDVAVEAFVNSNGELAAALGIALEGDEANKGDQVQNAPEKKNIFARAWDAIVKFFRYIGGKIADFFRWIFNGFKKRDQRAESAQKNWGQMSPEERKKFLDEKECDVSMDLTLKRTQSLITLYNHMGQFNNITVKDLMNRYYRNPSDIYNADVAKALRVFGGVIKSKEGNVPLEEAIQKSSNDFVGMTFVADWSNREQADRKTFRAHGWSEASVDQYFKISQDAFKKVEQMEGLVSTWEKAAANTKPEEFEKLAEELKKDNNNWFWRFFQRGSDAIHAYNELNKGNNGKGKDADAIRKGVSSVLQVFRMIATASKELFVSDNRILDAFRNSADQNKAKNA